MKESLDKRAMSQLNVMILKTSVLIGLVAIGGVIAATVDICHDLKNAREAKKTLSQIPALSVTGVKVLERDPRQVLVLLDKNGDKEPDFAVKPQQSIDFETMNGQPGDKWSEVLHLRTFQDLQK